MAKPTRQEIDRIIVGNQIAMMRALSRVSKNLIGDMNLANDLDIRVTHIKDWWKFAYEEEVGFSTLFDKK